MIKNKSTNGRQDVQRTETYPNSDVSGSKMDCRVTKYRHCEERAARRDNDGSAKGEGLVTTSPCVGICSTTYGDDICLGCKRNYLEVIRWNDMTDKEKNKINRRLMNEAKASP